MNQKLVFSIVFMCCLTANSQTNSIDDAQNAVCKYLQGSEIVGGCPGGLELVDDDGETFTFKAKEKNYLHVLYYDRATMNVDSEGCSLDASGCK